LSLSLLDRFLAFGLVSDRLEFAVLGDAVQIGDAGALDRKGLPSRFAGTIVTDETIGTFPDRIVGVVRLPFDDGRAFTHPLWRGGERAVDRRIGRRILREHAYRYAECHNEHWSHPKPAVHEPSVGETV